MEKVTITTRPNGPYLVKGPITLLDPKGKVLAENDDVAPDNLNSRLVFTAPKAALYRIVATSFQQRGQGAYTLTIRELKAGGVSARTAWVGR